MRPTLALMAIALTLLAGPGHAQFVNMPDADHPCGPIRTPGHYGPYDYNTNRDKLGVVEWYHFRPQVAALIKPMFSSFGADISYTLKAFPNHHRALETLIRLYDREPGAAPRESAFTYDCWFERAMRWRPDDLVARLLWASFLIKTKRPEMATAELAYADATSGEDGFSHHNIGLLYARMGAFDQALVQAHRAQALGFVRDDLRDILVKAGRWSDQPPAATSATAPARAASAGR